MNLYLLTQNENNKDCYGYQSAVVIARSADEAITVHPDGPGGWQKKYSSWASSPDNVAVKLIGRALEGVNRVDVVCVGS